MSAQIEIRNCYNIETPLAVFYSAVTNTLLMFSYLILLFVSIIADIFIFLWIILPTRIRTLRSVRTFIGGLLGSFYSIFELTYDEDNI